MTPPEPPESLDELIAAEGTQRDPMAAMREIAERIRQITEANQSLFRQAISNEQRFRGLAKAVWKVQEQERQRLARELHDGIGQTLTALKNQLQRLTRDADDLPQGFLGKLVDSVELTSEALHQTRELSRLLRPPVLDDLGLAAALRWLSRTMAERSGIAIELQVEGLEERVDPELETLVFRVTQEALTNALKHAETEVVHIELEVTDQALNLRIRDEGRGFDLDSILPRDGESPGFGLRGMRDRVELFGGRFRIETEPGSGTSLFFHLPLHPIETEV